MTGFVKQGFRLVTVFSQSVLGEDIYIFLKEMHTEKLLVALYTSDQVKHLQENTIQRMAFNFILVTVDRIGIVA